MYKIIPLPNISKLQGVLTTIIDRHFPNSLTQVLNLNPLLRSHLVAQQLIECFLLSQHNHWPIDKIALHRMSFDQQSFELMPPSALRKLHALDQTMLMLADIIGQLSSTPKLYLKHSSLSRRAKPTDLDDLLEEFPDEMTFREKFTKICSDALITGDNATEKFFNETSCKGSVDRWESTLEVLAKRATSIDDQIELLFQLIDISEDIAKDQKFFEDNPHLNALQVRLNKYYQLPRKFSKKVDQLTQSLQNHFDEFSQIVKSEFNTIEGITPLLIILKHPIPTHLKKVEQGSKTSDFNAALIACVNQLDELQSAIINKLKLVVSTKSESLDDFSSNQHSFGEITRFYHHLTFISEEISVNILTKINQKNALLFQPVVDLMIKLKSLMIKTKFAQLNTLSKTRLGQQRLLPVLLNRIRSRVEEPNHIKSINQVILMPADIKNAYDFLHLLPDFLGTNVRALQDARDHIKASLGHLHRGINFEDHLRNFRQPNPLTSGFDRMMKLYPALHRSQTVEDTSFGDSPRRPPQRAHATDDQSNPSNLLLSSLNSLILTQDWEIIFMLPLKTPLFDQFQVKDLLLLLLEQYSNNKQEALKRKLITAYLLQKHCQLSVKKDNKKKKKKGETKTKSTAPNAKAALRNEMEQVLERRRTTLWGSSKHESDQLIVPLNANDILKVLGTTTPLPKTLRMD